MKLIGKVTRKVKRGRPSLGTAHKLPYFTKGCISLGETLELWRSYGIEPLGTPTGYAFKLLSRKETIELIESCITITKLDKDSGIDQYSSIKYVGPPIEDEDLWETIENKV